ncbi:MAG: aspartyl protease family protein [Acidobacteriia bacterium]|nr:aspartyl protease family protein [Terriglobia bacterium]
MIALDIQGGSVWLPVKVNGSAPLNFLLDSGAVRSVVARDTAERLGLQIVELGEQVVGSAEASVRAAASFFGYFFRDPERPIPAEPGAVVSPADGKVVFVDEVQERGAGVRFPGRIRGGTRFPGRAHEPVRPRDVRLLGKRAGDSDAAQGQRSLYPGACRAARQGADAGGDDGGFGRPGHVGVHFALCGAARAARGRAQGRAEPAGAAWDRRRRHEPAIDR